MRKIDEYQFGLENSMIFTQVFKEKIRVILRNNLQNSIRFIVHKQKIQHLLKMHEITKSKLTLLYDRYLEIKVLKKNNKYSEVFYKLGEFKENIDRCNKDIGVGKLVIFNNFNEKCEELYSELSQSCTLTFANLFLTKKKEKYQQLFLFYYANGDYIEV